MQINGYEVKAGIEYPDGTVKVIKSKEELRELASMLNANAMRALGAVPIEKIISERSSVDQMEN